MRKLVSLAVITAFFVLMTAQAVAETVEAPKPPTATAVTQVTGEFGVFFAPIASSEYCIEQSSFQVFYIPEVVTVLTVDAPILLTEKEMRETKAP